MTQPPVLLAVSHGTSFVQGARAIQSLVTAVSERLADVEVVAGFVDVQQPDVPTALASLAGRDVVLVPLLLSAGYHVRVDISRAVRHSAARVRVAPALGPDQRLAQVLADRLREVDEESGSGNGPIVLCAAGSSDKNAADDCVEMGSLFQQEVDAEVTVAYLAASQPSLSEALTSLAQPATATVVTYLLATGYFDTVTSRICDQVGVRRRTLPLLIADRAPANALVELVIDRYRQAQDTQP